MRKIYKQSRKVGKGVAGISSLLPGPNQVRVGFPAGEADSDVINRAVWNEFGTKGGASGGGWGGPIPERPFLRNAMRDNQANLRAAMKQAAVSILKRAAMGDSAAMLKLQALRKIGVLAQGYIQEEITSLSSPPNSPVTIERKGSSNPLIDTGEMRASVTYKVENGRR